MKRDSRSKTLTVELIPRIGSDLRLDDFLEEMEALKSALRETERLISDRDPSLYLRINKLQKNSPAIIELEACLTGSVNGQSPQFARRVVHSMTTNLSVIRNRHRPKKINVSTLQAYQELTKPITRGLHATVRHENKTVELNEQFAEAIRAVIGDDEVSYGSLSGRIEAMSTHARNSFSLYPVVGATKVVGHFPNSRRRQFADAMDRYVTVWGRLKYKTWDSFPHEILADDILIHDEAATPRLLECRGMAPHATGPLTAREFVDAMRDE